MDVQHTKEPSTMCNSGWHVDPWLPVTLSYCISQLGLDQSPASLCESGTDSQGPSIDRAEIAFVCRTPSAAL